MMRSQVFGFVLLAVLFWGVTPVMEKLGFVSADADVDPFVALVFRSLAAFLGLVILTVALGKWQSLIGASPRTLGFFSMSGITAGLLGTWAYLTAMKSGDAHQIVPLSATYPLVTAILGFLVLKEDVTLAKLLGTSLVIVGIWLLK